MSKSRKGARRAAAAQAAAASSTSSADEDAIEREVLANPRIATGTLASVPHSRDVHIENFSLRLWGHELLQDSNLELNYGRRYGLVGANGSGKSTMLMTIAKREIPIPDGVDMFLLDGEVEASDVSALDAVLAETDRERERLEKAIEVEQDENPEGADELSTLYERLEELDADTSSARAGQILHGLGFTKKMQAKATKDFSGGWRMRIALAKALFIKPMLLLLDEPTNHLDIEACVWLEEYLKSYPHILLLVSHSQDFMNGVCTNIIHLHQKQLTVYGGNYDTYVKTRAELEENQMKKYAWEQAQIADMKDYIARFGHGSAKLARQAQSKEKVLAKMEAGGLTQLVQSEKTLHFKFPDCGKLPPPVMQFNQVAFGYSSEKEIYHNLDFGIDLDSRIALVGPNGAGKSTLLKLMAQELVPTSGTIRQHNHLVIARYNQHSTEQLDYDLTPCEFMMKKFPETITLDNVRSSVGRFGITGDNQMQPISKLSDGLKSRLVFAYLANRNPHMLLLDEPTNHLDIETIDSLAAAINEFEGGLVLVSHDLRLISQVCKEIWLCDKGGITVLDDDIAAYKKRLRTAMGLE
jgi:ATP-binding cassette subfamily F protein 2